MKKFLLGCMVLVASVTFTGCGGDMAAMEQHHAAEHRVTK